jgi:hypothetical protein
MIVCNRSQSRRLSGNDLQIDIHNLTRAIGDAINGGHQRIEYWLQNIAHARDCVNSVERRPQGWQRSRSQIGQRLSPGAGNFATGP